MRSIQFQVFFLALVLLTIPASVSAKEGDYGARGSEPSTALKDFVTKTVVKESAKTIAGEFGRVAARLVGLGVDIAWPTRLGDATLPPEARPSTTTPAALQCTLPEGAEAATSKPAAEPKPVAQPRSAPRQVVDKGDNADRLQKGGDRSRTTSDGGRADPRGDAGLGNGPSHERVH